MHRDLQHRIVVLTGASRGLGVTIAQALARRGAHVVLVARTARALDAVAETVRAADGLATVLPADLTRPEDRAALVEQLEALGPVEGIVHNAGAEVTMAFANQTPEDLDRQLDLDLSAPLHLTHALLPAMLDRGRGAIVFISSMSGKSATPWNAVYAAAKHGLVGFASSLRTELSGTGVHVGVVCPGFVSGDGMWADLALPAPAMMKEVTREQVAEAVLKVLDGAPEVLVTRMPIRPLLALAQLFPSLDAFVLRAGGILPTLRARHDIVSSRRRRASLEEETDVRIS